MSSGSRRAEFFAVEAEEYLLDLELMASAHEVPDAERMIRGARALRGASLVAGLGTYARAAAGLEALARKLRDETLPWDSAARDQCLAIIAALRGLLARVRNWDAEADREALQLAERTERFSGSRPARMASAASQTLSTGVRAFIAKESALIASSLERAARALSPTPPNDALAAVLERMRSLRGLGASADLSPLPELLDAMEVATRALLGDHPQPPDVAAVFEQAAHALAAIARTIAENGRIVVPPELDRVAILLLAAFAEEADVVPISSLAPDHTESVLHAGTRPAPPPGAIPVPIELVGVGDHLLRAADQLSRPTPPVVRDLRLFVLPRTLATMPSRSATGAFLAPLTAAINGAIRQGVAAREPERFISLLRDCGHFLMESGSRNDLAALMRDRDRLVETRSEERDAGSEKQETRSEKRETSGELESEIVSIESLAPDARSVEATESDVVPIESLAPDLDVIPIEHLAPDLDVIPIAALAPDVIHTNDDDLIGTPIVPIEALAPDEVRFPFAGLIPHTAPGEPSRLELAWARQGDLAAQDDLAPPSLERLLQQDILPMEELLYRGATALARAEEIHRGIAARLREPTISLDHIRPDLEELLDLVALARDAA